MVKRITSFALILTLLSAALFALPAYASDAITREASETVEVEYLENGDCIETVLVTCTDASADASILASTKTGSKTKNYKNSSGAVMWSVKVSATFSYNGSTSTCTGASHNTTSPGTAWSIKSSSVSKSGNKATAKATATYKTDTGSHDYSMSVSLSCSATGTLS